MDLRYLQLASLLKLRRENIAGVVAGSAEREGGDSPRHILELSTLLEPNDPVELFWGLYAAFTAPRASGGYQRQALAGTLLLRLRPPCPLAAYEAIQQVLGTWEVSVEELPWYLAMACGEEAVWKALERLESEPLDERERLVLNTFRRWVLPGWRDNPLARWRLE
jgi:hypothetical protein